MRKLSDRMQLWRLGTLLMGTALFLNGCDPTLQATVEDGIITTSSSFVGSLFRALIELWSAQAAA